MDLLKNYSSELARGSEDLTDRVLDWARDRTEALEGSGAASQVKPSQEGKEGVTDRVLDWAPDGTEALEESGAASQVKPSQEMKPEPSPRVIVVALHEGADACGEAHLFEDLQAAGRFIETLVEGGLDHQRLSVFNCARLNVHLTYRPVVHLKASEAQEEPASWTNP